MAGKHLFNAILLSKGSLMSPIFCRWDESFTTCSSMYFIYDATKKKGTCTVAIHLMLYMLLSIAGDDCLTECVTSALIGHRSIDNKIAAGHFNFESTSYRSNAVSVDSEEEMFSNLFSPEFGTVLVCINNNSGDTCTCSVYHTYIYVIFSSIVSAAVCVQALKNGRNVISVVDSTESVDSTLAVISSKFPNDTGNESEYEVPNQQD